MAWALRTTLGAGLVCILATHFLAGATAPDPARRPTVARAVGMPDPETTGAIGTARAVRLDPCAVAARPARP